MSLHRLWLIFCQTATVALGILFVIITLRPEWLGGKEGEGLSEVIIKQSAPDLLAKSKPAAASYNEAVMRAAPAVVNIFTSRAAKAPRHPLMEDPVFREFFGDSLDEPQTMNSLGSGVIVNEKGYVLTNNHVVEGMDEIEVLLADNTRLPAKVVGTDPESDLAVLKIEVKKALPAIVFGSLDTVHVGDVVLAIGNPFGVGQTVTLGIVSALGRTHLGINTYENFIQTDAAINPGNSGGALIDSAGTLVGVNTAIFSRTGGSLGIGFAIPVSTAKQVMEQIIETGEVTRGFIGVEAQQVTEELAEAFKLPDTQGAVIAGVVAGGPAAQAGVRVRDVLLAIDSRNIDDPTTMLNVVAELKPGSKVPLRVRREGKELELEIVVGRRPKQVRPQ
ncbi:MAG TPA: Do family serine endopeptidase [Burkholderiales bacterium]|nr:Do family serine endopeptidase [Burkholderiales bacterium]